MFVKDIFYSIQGEALLIGLPQVFIRFFGCNIICDYCDEPDLKHQKKKTSVDDVLAMVNIFKKKHIHSISITGGEPLLYVDFLKELCPKLKYPLYLETNGTLPDRIAEIKDYFTYFSVDFKPGYEKEFADFMFEINDKEHVFIKYVLKHEFDMKDIQTMSKIVTSLGRDIPLYIQPVTPYMGVKKKATPKEIMKAFTLASKTFKEVRVIPQTHKFMGLQ